MYEISEGLSSNAKMYHVYMCQNWIKYMYLVSGLFILCVEIVRMRVAGISQMGFA